jgi:hypothetical protein
MFYSHSAFGRMENPEACGEVFKGAANEAVVAVIEDSARAEAVAGVRAGLTETDGFRSAERTALLPKPP